VRQNYPQRWRGKLLEDADKIIQGQVRYYAYHWKTLGSPPKWFINPFNNRSYPNSDYHWTELSDFNPDVGDIKNVWEASRFEWVVTLARSYAVSGKTAYLDVLNNWLKNWAKTNPLNIGPNWKCGQEASIRVFNLINAALFLNQWKKPSPVLKYFIYLHLERISANIRYAIAQDNNHGSSEAAALFIGGHWLSYVSSNPNRKKRCQYFARKGRKWLENRVEKLVEEDGSFSQHSVTYHRVLLDTLIFTEFWRRRLEVNPFSDKFYQRAKAALNCMYMLTDEISGNAPNLGANDGALFLNNHSCDYRDFRPSIQTASILFNEKRIYENGPWDEPCYWFGLKYEKTKRIDKEKTSKVFPGGYVIMQGRNSWGVIKFPMYRFRPSHNDVFHFDLWYRGKNICRDSGSFSYYAERKSDSQYFRSVKAHNTVSFDNHEQMPRVGRFLMGKWIRADYVGAIESYGGGEYCWRGAYKDYQGNRHERSVVWQDDCWIIKDCLSGPFERAEILYRLIPATYKIEGNRVIAPWGTIEIIAYDCGISMSSGFESLYYWDKQPVDTLILNVGKNIREIKTIFTFE